MDGVSCGSVLLCLWEPVQQALQDFLDVGYLSNLRERFLGSLSLKKGVIIPISASVVGREQILLEIQKHLRDDVVGIIGIQGMGGVGKSTILKKINNDLVTAGKHGFDIIIFVTVTKNADVFKIQEEIGVRLGIPRLGEMQGQQLPRDEGGRMCSLHEALSKMKFLLLLDDVWKKLDLQRIGIPDPRSTHKKAKVVFATRSREVCAYMDAQKRVKVSVCNETESWNLFCSKLQPEVPLHEDIIIRELAKLVVSKCGGLPLALVTMGQAMSHATTVSEWQVAVRSLRRTPDMILGMEHVLSILLFSFDSLLDDVTRECLLYCCLFPEDYSIRIDQLVEYWIGEGFLDAGAPDSGSISRARDIGYRIIRKLKDTHLLESGKDKEHVKMHGIVRMMALWLTGDKFDTSKRFIVCGDTGSTHFLEVDEWESARRISLMQQEVFKLPSPAFECPNLLTLLAVPDPLTVRRQEAIVVPRKLFEFMPALRVLDLSHANVTEIPGEIGLLVELRYLNLSWTKIRQLPEELGKLLKLRELSLWGTVELSQIPRKAIITLTRLQRLNLYQCGFSVSFGNDDSEGIKWTDLDLCFGKLEEFSVDMHNTPSLELLATSCKLSRCITVLRLVDISDLSSSLLSIALGQLVNMTWLSIEDCHHLEELRITGGRGQLQSLRYLGLARLTRLRNVILVDEPMQADQDVLSPLLPRIQHLEIDSCDGLKNLGWLRQLPFLEKLLLWSCEGVEVMLPPQVDGSCASSLPRLKYMSFVNMISLKNISAGSSTFPSLEVLWVSGCPLLRRLPIGGRNWEKIREIFGSREWWDSLEWEDDGDDIGPASNQPSSLCFALREVFHPISSSSLSEINDQCRRRFLV